VIETAERCRCGETGPLYESTAGRVCIECYLAAVEAVAGVTPREFVEPQPLTAPDRPPPEPTVSSRRVAECDACGERHETEFSLGLDARLCDRCYRKAVGK
jgi:hypothetical protein